MKEQKASRAIPSIDADLPAGEMERILRRIEENLAFRKVLQDDSRLASQLPAIPPLAGFDERHHRLRRLNAPFFVPEGRGLSALFRRFLNLPLRLLGHKQAQFNQQTIDLTTQLAASSHQSLTEQRNALVALSKEVEDLREEIQRLRKQADEPAEGS